MVNCDVFSDFFERTIHLNSMVWSCAVTGRSGLTFEEALDSEKQANASLESFPEFLEMPLLYLVHKFTYRGRLDDLVNDVFAFMKERYFVGEELTFVESRKKKRARVLNVMYIGPEQNGVGNDVHPSEDDPPSRFAFFHLFNQYFELIFFIV